MQRLIKLEEVGLTVLAVALFLGLDLAWWWLVALFFAPDLAMAGYLAGPQIGAALYNLVHHRGLAAALIVIGLGLGSVWLQGAGLILLAHSSFDRTLGYGLKYPDAFQHTHLGWIGRRRPDASTLA
jgi:hypothetical protein